MSSVPMPRDLSEEAVAEWLHDDYERSARAVGWKTQEACRVPFADLPVANQQVMLMTARAVLALVEAKVREAAVMDRGYSRATEGLRKGSYFIEYHMAVDEIVARVMNKEATNG